MLLARVRPFAAGKISCVTIFCVATSTLLLTASCERDDADEAPRRPNVILLVIDTLRADHLNGYGYDRETSPTLDGLMSAGVRFDTAIASSSWSAPSHASIATGTYAYTHRVLNFGQQLAPKVEPVAVALKEAGYSTGLFSTHFALHNSVERLDEGIDTRVVRKNEEDAEILDEAARWATQQDSPFFLYMVVMGPHAPYTQYPPEDDSKYFTDTRPGGEVEFDFTETTWVGEGGIPRSVRLGDRRDVGYYVNRYDRAIRHTDALLGDFLERLRKAGQMDDTIVIVTSDHGEGLGDHGCFAHELYLYDFLVRVPMIVSWPGEIPAGQVWDDPVPSVDIVPTLLGLVDAPAANSVEGRDLSAGLREESPPSEPTLAFSSYRNRGYDRYMVRSDRFKLILDAVGRSEEFYDLQGDPAEQVNLAANPPAELPAEYETLQEAMLDYLTAHTGVGEQLVPVSMSPEVIAELKLLGYLSDEE